MGNVAFEWWALILGVTALGVFAMLHALAAGLRDVQRIIELKAEVKRLRDEHARRTEEMRSRQGLG